VHRFVSSYTKLSLNLYGYKSVSFFPHFESSGSHSWEEDTHNEGMKAKGWGGVPTLTAIPLAMPFGGPFAIETLLIATEMGVGTHCVEDVDEDDCA
jgi:hypothetical protein